MDRVELAKENFKKGYNCSQSVVTAYADLFGVEPELAAKMAEGFGVPNYMPPLSLCGDNAAMIGAQAYYEFLAGNTGTIWQNAFATAEISEKICQKNGIAKRRAKR